MSAFNDRELLELAAKAAGLTGEVVTMAGGEEPIFVLAQGSQPWPGGVFKPVADHADAERLRNMLNIRLEFEHYNGADYAYATPPGTHQGYDELITDGSTEAGMLAANRAIVRAAAEIGRAMP